MVPDSRLLKALSSQVPEFVQGQGIYLYDSVGRRYLDGSSGSVAASLGHGNHDMVRRLTDQAMHLAFVHRSQGRTAPAERLADLVAQVSPRGLERSFFLNGGSEAIELALRIARLYWLRQGWPRKELIASRWLSYHGNSLGALGVSGHAARRKYLDTTPREGGPIVHPPYLYRCPLEGGIGDCMANCITDIDEAFAAYGHERIAAFITEPIGGAASGAIVPPPGYYEQVRQLCDRHSVLWIADEIMTGFGRTGKWFATQHWSAVPDIMVLGKGISGGYMPLAGVVCTDRVADSLTNEDISYMGHTFSNTPLACAVGVAAVDYMREHNLVKNAARMGRYLEAGLQSLLSSCDLIGDVRGKGLLWGVEFVEDKAKRRPFPPKANFTHKILRACLENGLILYPALRAASDLEGDAVLVAPPLTITKNSIDELIGRLEKSLALL